MRPVVLALVLLACAAPRSASHPIAGACRLELAGNTILCGDALYATVETSFCRRGATGVADRVDCFGLAVRYADGEQVWLYRGRNLDGAQVQGRYVANDLTESRLGGVFGIEVAAGGRAVRWRDPATGAAWEYGLEDGRTRRVERAAR